jgi:hypothetical protein
MKTVASLVKRFGKVHSEAESLVDFRIGRFCLLRKAGIVRGSEYVGNSGEKMHELWQELLGGPL